MVYLTDPFIDLSESLETDCVQHSWSVARDFWDVAQAVPGSRLFLLDVSCGFLDAIAVHGD